MNAAEEDRSGVSMRVGPEGVEVVREPVTSEPAPAPSRERTWSPLQETVTPALRFASVRLSADQVLRAQAVRDAFVLLMETIERNVRPGRERAIVTTHLEDASMWATKGISREIDRPPR